MTFKHPNFEFKLVEYPNQDGQPPALREDFQNEKELAKEGWIRTHGVFGDSAGIAVVYRRKKAPPQQPGKWSTESYTHRTQGGCYSVRDSGKADLLEVQDSDSGEILPCGRAYFEAEFILYRRA